MEKGTDMERLIELIRTLNDWLNRFAWGPATIFLLALAGLLFSVGTGFFQLRRWKTWLAATLGAALKGGQSGDGKGISAFQSACTALAATLGTGNIAGVATALAAGAAQGAIEYQMMASVMVGGMVPPIAIALCTTFFKKKFTADERKSGIVNYIMGLCFISEGAIPFAAADPLRVIPSCVVGSAVAGALSMVFGCGLMAPHGGIFVFPVVTNVLGYIISLAAGSAVGMALLAVLKKNKEA